MSVLKKKKVVMLSTNEKAKIYTDRYGNLKLHSSKSTLPLGSIGSNQHLYITSDEKAQEGDWILGWQHGIDGTPESGAKHYVRFHDNSPAAKLSAMSVGAYKIIATTDSSLTYIFDTITFRHAEPSQSFIEKYVELYNKGQQITEVMVEYEEMTGDELGVDPAYYTLKERLKLKINPTDNTITIKRVKDSWNITEIEEIHLAIIKQGSLYEGGTWSDEHERLVRLEFKKYKDQNL